MQHLFTLCSMVNVLFQAPPFTSSISAPWIINYTEFSSAFILLSCGCHLPTEGKKNLSVVYKQQRVSPRDVLALWRVC